jgi:archaellum component FlaC
MMMVDIYDEIHEIREHVNQIDKNVVRLTTLVEGIAEETKVQKEKISRLQKFKNRIIGAFTISHIGLICLIPLLVAVL